MIKKIIYSIFAAILTITPSLGDDALPTNFTFDTKIHVSYAHMVEPESTLFKTDQEKKIFFKYLNNYYNEETNTIYISAIHFATACALALHEIEPQTSDDAKKDKCIAVAVATFENATRANIGEMQNANKKTEQNENVKHFLENKTRNDFIRSSYMNAISRTYPNAQSTVTDCDPATGKCVIYQVRKATIGQTITVAMCYLFDISDVKLDANQFSAYISTIKTDRKSWYGDISVGLADYDAQCNLKE